MADALAIIASYLALWIVCLYVLFILDWFRDKK